MAHIPEHLRFKFSQQLLDQLEGIGTPVKVLIQVAAGQVSIAASTIASLGGRIEFQSELTNQISLTIDDSQLPALASLGSVLSVFHVPKGEILALAGHRGVPHAGILPLAGLAAVSVTLEDTTNYIGAPKMWDRGFLGQGIKIGVIDTGIDKDHPMLQGKVVAEKHFAGTGPEDSVGHGTWVASAAAGREWMSLQGPMIGVAPQAVLVNAKAFDTENSDLDIIMAALEWAALQGCHVLNNSWGGEDYPPLHLLVQAIRARGQVVVAAAGNSGPALGTVQFPGGYAEAIGVGSIATVAPAPDAVADFSSRGPGPGGITKPDLCAPGGTEEECIFGAERGGGAGCFRGSSMATPHVSGAVALLLSASASPVPQARDIGAQGADNDSGFGALTFNGTPVPSPGQVSQLTDFAPAIAFGVVAAFFFTLAFSQR